MLLDSSERSSSKSEQQVPETFTGNDADDANHRDPPLPRRRKGALHRRRDCLFVFQPSRNCARESPALARFLLCSHCSPHGLRSWSPKLRIILRIGVFHNRNVASCTPFWELRRSYMGSFRLALALPRGFGMSPPPETPICVNGIRSLTSN